MQSMPASVVAPPALAKPAFLSLHSRDPRQRPECPEVRRRASESSLRPGIPGPFASELRPRSEVTAALDLLSACSLRPSSVPPAPARSASTVVKCEMLGTEASSEPVHPGRQEQPMAMASPQSLKSAASSSPRRSPCPVMPFVGSFVLRNAATEVPIRSRQGLHEAARPSRPQQKQEMRRLAEDARICAKDEVTSVSPARPEFQTHDTTFSPVRLSPPTSGLPCSPGESQDWSVLQVCRIDAGTQTASSERQSSDDGRLRDEIAADTLEDEVLWLRSRNLPACISALAIQDEATANQSQSHCLRKLEVRVASCWRQPSGHRSSLKGSEHSSLQLSSTQSPTSTAARENIGSEGSATDRCRLQHTPTDSFSSVSSPLDSMSLLKDLEMPSPQWVQVQAEDVAKLPVQDLQRRAEALTQKLQHREHQCMVLREALEACNNRFTRLRPEMSGAGQMLTRE